MTKSFQKVLRLPDAVSLVMGIMIGTGIFLTTSFIAQHIPDSRWILLAWLGGGFLSFTGAITLAQLAEICPESGGIYSYLREAFGNFVAFVYGWACFFVLQGGSIAAIAIGFAYYFSRIVPAEKWLGQWGLYEDKLFALLAIAILSAFNYLGARLGSRIQNSLTALKVIGLVAIVLCALPSDLRSYPIVQVEGDVSLVGFFTGLVAIIWTFAGWYNLNFAAEEVENPQRNVPLALALGIVLTTVFYMAINYVYLTTMTLAQAQQSKAIAYDSIARLLGPQAGIAVSILVVVSSLGSLNGLILASPRLYFVMARDKLFGHFSARLHPRYQTPHTFIVIQGVWTSFLVVSGTYDTLVTYVMFLGLIFTALCSIALFVLKRRNGVQTLFCNWAYPLFPVLFFLCFLLLAGSTLLTHPKESLQGVGIVLLAVPLYHLTKKGN